MEAAETERGGTVRAGSDTGLSERGERVDRVIDMRAAQHDERFLLQVVQPALVGLMDGSVSTLAPIFASAYATQRPHTAFLVGMAAAIGAGISMGFAEALSDTGELTGRGHPVRRGVITGGATFVGGVLHTLPFLIANLHVALYVAYFVVGFELITIALIRHRYFQMALAKSIVQVVIGGGLVFLAGVLIGQA
jgi:VIT1/CCC1 family predicted Fe2+/Mn2+ transporter